MQSNEIIRILILGLDDDFSKRFVLNYYNQPTDTKSFTVKLKEYAVHFRNLLDHSQLRLKGNDSYDFVFVTFSIYNVQANLRRLYQLFSMIENTTKYKYACLIGFKVLDRYAVVDGNYKEYHTEKDTERINENDENKKKRLHCYQCEDPLKINSLIEKILEECDLGKVDFIGKNPDFPVLSVKNLKERMSKQFPAQPIKENSLSPGSQKKKKFQLAASFENFNEIFGSISKKNELDMIEGEDENYINSSLSKRRDTMDSIKSIDGIGVDSMEQDEKEMEKLRKKISNSPNPNQRRDDDLRIKVLKNEKRSEKKKEKEELKGVEFNKKEEVTVMSEKSLNGEKNDNEKGDTDSSEKDSGNSSPEFEAELLGDILELENMLEKEKENVVEDEDKKEEKKEKGKEKKKTENIVDTTKTKIAGEEEENKISKDKNLLVIETGEKDEKEIEKEEKEKKVIKKSKSEEKEKNDSNEALNKEEKIEDNELSNTNSIAKSENDKKKEEKKKKKSQFSIFQKIQMKIKRKKKDKASPFLNEVNEITKNKNPAPPKVFAPIENNSKNEVKQKEKKLLENNFKGGSKSGGESGMLKKSGGDLSSSFFSMKKKGKKKTEFEKFENFLKNKYYFIFEDEPSQNEVGEKNKKDENREKNPILKINKEMENLEKYEDILKGKNFKEDSKFNDLMKFSSTVNKKSRNLLLRMRNFQNFYNNKYEMENLKKMIKILQSIVDLNEKKPKNFDEDMIKIEKLNNDVNEKTFLNLEFENEYKNYEKLYRELRQKRKDFEQLILDNEVEYKSTEDDVLDGKNFLKSEINELNKKLKKIEDSNVEKIYHVFKEKMKDNFKQIKKKVINEEKNVLKGFLCPLSKKLMRNPVVLVETSTSFERDAIVKWLENNDVDPIYNKKLETKQIIENIALKHVINEKF